jgi:flagellar motor switch protein FliG
MIETNTELTGLEKASVLLMSVGQEASRAILDRLSPEERDVLGAQIVRMRSVKSIVREKVLGEVSAAVKSGKEAGSPNPPGILPGGSHHTSLQPFVWLEDLEAERVAEIVKGERPNTIALVLSHLSPGVAASVLACLDENTRDRTAQGLAGMTKASDEVVRGVDEMVRKRAFGSPQTSGRHGTAPILKSLAEATARAKESMLAAMSREHIVPVHPPSSPLAKGGRRGVPADPEMPSLEELANLPDAQVRPLLGDVDLDDLCLALRVASPELTDAVLRNVPVSTAALMRERLQSTAQIRIREIEIAQRGVLGAVRRTIHLDGHPEPPPFIPPCEGGTEGGARRGPSSGGGER